MEGAGKRLIWILRHGAIEFNLTVQPDGFIKLVDILADPKILARDLTIDHIHKIIELDADMRFELAYSNRVNPSHWLIRATQGHSMHGIDDERLMTRVYAGDIKDVRTLARWTPASNQSATELKCSLLPGGCGVYKTSRKHVYFKHLYPTSKKRGRDLIPIYLDVAAAFGQQSRLKWFRSGKR